MPENYELEQPAPNAAPEAWTAYRGACSDRTMAAHCKHRPDLLRLRLRGDLHWGLCRAAVKMRMFVLYCSLASIASLAQGTEIITGIDCELWVKNPDRPTRARLLGQFRPLTLASAIKFNDPLYEINVDPTYLWMDKHCRENPPKTVPVGARELDSKLRKK